MPKSHLLLSRPLAQVLAATVGFAGTAPALASASTSVAIVGEAFHINGQPTYKGRVWQGHDLEGLLLNARLVQGIFDDLNPSTVSRWAYPDTGRWDAERNTREFIAAMPEWRRHGLLAFTINLQGGSPEGYSKAQPWHNSAFQADGSLRADYLARLKRIINRADQLGMVVIVGYFYFGQDHRLRDEAAVARGADHATRWLLDHDWRNVLVEIANETDVGYHHALLQPGRVHELILRVKEINRDGRRLLAGTSYGGGRIPGPNVVRASDFLLLHGNGVSDPKRIADMVRQTRALPGYTPMPILFNEDDHLNFDQPDNNFIAAVSQHASWGYFDYRRPGEGFAEGYQSLPVNWGLSSARKRAFFRLLAEMTGSAQLGRRAAAGWAVATAGEIMAAPVWPAPQRLAPDLKGRIPRQFSQPGAAPAPRAGCSATASSPQAGATSPAAPGAAATTGIPGLWATPAPQARLSL